MNLSILSSFPSVTKLYSFNECETSHNSTGHFIILVLLTKVFINCCSENFGDFPKKRSLWNWTLLRFISTTEFHNISENLGTNNRHFNFVLLTFGQCDVYWKFFKRSYLNVLLEALPGFTLTSMLSKVLGSDFKRLDFN